MRAALLAVARPALAAAPASAAPELVKIGDFNAPVHVASPPQDTRVFVVEQRGAIRIAGGGTFLDLTGADALRRRARPAVDRLRARLRHQRPLLRVPDLAPERRRRGTSSTGGRPPIPTSPTRPRSARCSTSRTVPETTTAASCSSGRTARCTRASATTRAAATPRTRARRSARSTASTPSRAARHDLVLRPAQPVALQLRPRDGRPADRRRRRERLRGDQLVERAERGPGRQLRLALQRGAERRRLVRSPRHALARPPVVLRDRRRLRGPRPRPPDPERPLPVRRQLQREPVVGRARRRPGRRDRPAGRRHVVVRRGRLRPPLRHVARRQCRLPASRTARRRRARSQRRRRSRSTPPPRACA